MLLPRGRSKTLNEGSGWFSKPSRAFPDDFRNVNPFDNLIGMEIGSEGCGKESNREPAEVAVKKDIPDDNPIA
jgi:hypothetical protein